MPCAPTTRQHRAAGERNGAAILSLFCAALWPLTVLIPLSFNAVPTLSGPALPDLVFYISAGGFALLPVIGIISGSLGFLRATHQPPLRRSRWQALTGLLLGSLWFIGAFFLCSLGPAVIYIWTHRRS
jgi:hypothetical protein